MLVMRSERHKYPPHFVVITSASAIDSSNKCLEVFVCAWIWWQADGWACHSKKRVRVGLRLNQVDQTTIFGLWRMSGFEMGKSIQSSFLVNSKYLAWFASFVYVHILCNAEPSIAWTNQCRHMFSITNLNHTSVLFCAQYCEMCVLGLGQALGGWFQALNGRSSASTTYAVWPAVWQGGQGRNEPKFGLENRRV